MNEDVVASARDHLASEGVRFGELVKCKRGSAPPSFGVDSNPWVVEFHSERSDGIMIEPEHTVVVFVDPTTMKAETLPSM